MWRFKNMWANKTDRQTNLYLLTSHVLPVQPVWQVQLKSLTRSEHWPPLRHGLGKQSLISEDNQWKITTSSKLHRNIWMDIYNAWRANWPQANFQRRYRLVDWIPLYGLAILGSGCNSSFGNQTTKDMEDMLDEYTMNTKEHSFVNPHPRWPPWH